MALIVLLRGVNVGGHRTFRPSVLAHELADYEVVNVGAAGTFVVFKPPSRTELRAAIVEQLPFDAEVVICDARDLEKIERDDPFGPAPATRDVVRFVSFLSKSSPARLSLPTLLPPDGDWALRINSVLGRFAFGEYRRNVKAIGQLGKLDDLFGVPTTTRNWNTVMSLVRIVKERRRRQPR